MTSLIETSCYGVFAENSNYRGEPENLCHVDCANRGICDYSKGKCQCFNGFYGPACDQRDPNAVYSVWNSKEL